eukprot:TRINITY_DN20428_c0_g1_i1.p1 TRINITY_DN20428_c0_g1~~TRINITY_DN20428_c0_g1_i1.p1  ORF type:complete len:259 (+),score=99.98 TRINITY_DN20428_c0_g1_i1:45-821(+)
MAISYEGQYSTPQRSEEHDGILRQVESVLAGRNEPMEDVPFMYHMNEWLSYSNANFAQSVNSLKEAGVGYVINLCAAESRFFPAELYQSYARNKIHVRKIPAVDGSHYPLLLHHFQECKEVTERCREENKRVLIHCLKGVNRSAAMAIALYMYFDKVSLINTVRAIHAKRPLLTNSHFRSELTAFSLDNTNFLVAPQLPDLDGMQSDSARNSSSSLSPRRNVSPVDFCIGGFDSPPEHDNEFTTPSPVRELELDLSVH